MVLFFLNAKAFSQRQRINIDYAEVLFPDLNYFGDRIGATLGGAISNSYIDIFPDNILKVYLNGKMISIFKLNQVFKKISIGTREGDSTLLILASEITGNNEIAR
ncbi:hypothetical protein [Arachidicoccus soli]|uniref:Uncharacterized protein n=1 Tax=Arachidicoccus soli TaxID=2341117 RepID=A0A386HLL2_9BACT|nr:hypothetical protein [Arachidicoccus soli]AYD46264.1 hypothetical protein D6B99_00690 [Arachidicoccus soli]